MYCIGVTHYFKARDEFGDDQRYDIVNAGLREIGYDYVRVVDGSPLQFSDKTMAQSMIQRLEQQPYTLAPGETKRPTYQLVNLDPEA